VVFDQRQVVVVNGDGHALLVGQVAALLGTLCQRA